MSGPIQDSNSFILPSDISKEDFLSHIAETRSTLAAENWALVFKGLVSFHKFPEDFNTDLVKTFNKYISQIRHLRNYPA